MIRVNKKGARGERDFAALVRKVLGFDKKQVYRTAQATGKLGMPDVTTPLPVHFEVKRVEKVNAAKIYQFMSQSIGDSRPGKTATVQWRTNGHEWLTILRATDYLKMFEDCNTEEGFHLTSDKIL